MSPVSVTLAVTALLCLVAATTGETKCDLTMGTKLEDLSNLKPQKVYTAETAHQCAEQCERDGCRGFAYNSNNKNCRIVGGCLGEKPLHQSCRNDSNWYSGICGTKDEKHGGVPSKPFHIKLTSSDSYIAGVKAGPAATGVRVLFSKNCDVPEATWRFVPTTIGKYGFLINDATGWYMQSGGNDLPVPNSNIILTNNRNLAALWFFDIKRRVGHANGQFLIASGYSADPKEGYNAHLHSPKGQTTGHHFTFPEVCPPAN